MLGTALTSAEWGAQVAEASKVFKPSGAGPFPVALILHGCGGKTPFLDEYARVAVEAGYAPAGGGRFAPRGMSALGGEFFVCAGMTPPGAQRSGHIFSLPSWLG